MKLKHLFLTSLFFLGISFPSCDSDDIDCDCPVVENFFDIQGLSVSAFQTLDGSIQTNIAENEIIVFDNLSNLRLGYQVDYHSCISSPNPFSLMNSAWACSCLWDGSLGSQTERLETVHVITLNDYNDNFLAHDTINDLILVDDFISGNTGDNALPLGEYLELDTALILYEALDIHLTTRPSLNDTLRLKVSVELSTGEVYEAENSPFIFM